MRMKKALRRMAWLGAAGAIGTAAAGVGVGLLGLAAWRRTTGGEEVNGRVALITGASRGLGLAMARELGQQGAMLVICARDREELDWAREELARTGADVLAIQCDVGNHDDVHRMVREAMERFGRIDILINNAGVIMVGPLPTQTMTDFQEAMDTMFWGAVYPTLAVLPHMMERRSGRIANVTSIGGKVAVPHLLPYTCAKFAAVGFSEGLHAEVAKYGIKVTTVVPGLMRTGSFVNAWFKGQNRAEYGWFSLSSAMPVLAMNGRRAARRIVSAIRRGEAEIILTPQARLLAMLNGVAPGTTADVMALVNRVLPSPDAAGRDRHLGKDSESAVSDSVLTSFGRRAAQDLHQYPERRRAGGEAPQPIRNPA
jgi:NAD(P)-dependent dehydrogenase (short-subunit alcohol dehydrogenase family)